MVIGQLCNAKNILNKIDIFKVALGFSIPSLKSKEKLKNRNKTIISF